MYAIPILIGINLLTFVLFFVVNSPDEIARLHLGDKHVTEVQINAWKHDRGYDKPLLINTDESGIDVLKETIFFDKSVRLFVFDFGVSDSGRNIGYDIKQRMWPSLAIAIPSLLIGLLINISFALLIAFFRATYIDYWGVIFCVALMSISSLFYIIGGQFLVGKLLQIVPISGYDYGLSSIKFLVLPILISAIYGIGAGTRWYRTLFLEEISKDYVRTARAKGLSEKYILFHHVVRNALIPIFTVIGLSLATLVEGSFIAEGYFGIPGIGSLAIEAFFSRDYPIITALVLIIASAFVIANLIVDIGYHFLDPRIRY